MVSLIASSLATATPPTPAGSPVIANELARNTAKACKHLDCYLTRLRLGSWCKKHDRLFRRLGHPDASTYRPKTWATQRKEVSQLLEAHPDHPGLRQVLAWVQRWMAEAAKDPTAYKGAREVHRLSLHGVTPLVVLTEVLAFWLWTEDSPHALPDDRSRDVACSRAVFALAPRPRQSCSTGLASGTWKAPTTGPKSYSIKALPSSLNHVGKHLRQSLAVFIATTQRGIEHQRSVKKGPAALQRLPFVV